jgi:hypothetical protein
MASQVSTHPLISTAKVSNDGAVKHGTNACNNDVKLATLVASGMDLSFC